MLAMVLEMSLTALSGAPVGTTGIGNVSVSVMSGQGGGRGAGASRIISSNSAIAETNGGQAKPVTVTALTCEVSGGGPSCGGLESFPLVISIQSSGMGGGRGNGSLTGGSKGGMMSATSNFGRASGGGSTRVGMVVATGTCGVDIAHVMEGIGVSPPRGIQMNLS